MLYLGICVTRDFFDEITPRWMIGSAYAQTALSPYSHWTQTFQRRVCYQYIVQRHLQSQELR